MESFNSVQNLRAEELTRRISRVSHGYSVMWDPSERAFDDDPPGMFDIIGADGKVHYRRRQESDVLALAGLSL